MEIEVCFSYNCLKNDEKDYVFAFYYHKIARKLLLNAPDEWNDTYPTRIEHGVKNVFGKSIYISCYKSFDCQQAPIDCSALIYTAYWILFVQR